VGVGWWGLELNNGWVQVDASAGHNNPDLSNCISHPFNTYTRCLSNFCCYGLAYTCPLTPVSPQTFPQIGEELTEILCCGCVQTMPNATMAEAV
jgi:hypothetical protein